LIIDHFYCKNAFSIIVVEIEMTKYFFSLLIYANFLQMNLFEVAKNILLG